MEGVVPVTSSSSEAEEAGSNVDHDLLGVSSPSTPERSSKVVKATNNSPSRSDPSSDLSPSHVTERALDDDTHNKSSGKVQRRFFILLSVGLILLALVVFVPLAAVLGTRAQQTSAASSSATNSSEPLDSVPGPAPVDTEDDAIPDDGNNPADTETDSGTNDPDLPATVMTPSLSPAVLSPTVMAAIASVVPENVMQDPTSAEALAVEWLRVTGFQSNSDERIRQRFAVTALDLALGADVAIAGGHECSWPGVECNDASQVTHIVWADQGLTGRLPSVLGLLTSLEHLDVAENAIIGTLPEALFALTELRNLYLFDNRIGGTLSESFAKLTKLRTFLAGNNRFSGPFPRGLGSAAWGAANVRTLRTLSLYKNQLTGTIPTMLNLREAAYIDLGFNNLNGTFPVDWVEDFNTLRNISSLFLDHNQLTGTIPDSVAQVGNSRLNQLVLADNRFTGAFSADWDDTGILSLNTLHIQNNQFSTMNKGICDQSVWEEGELTSMRADCEICQCDMWCDECY